MGISSIGGADQVITIAPNVAANATGGTLEPPECRVPRFNNVRTVPFSSDEMFALVADVEKYPLFVPLCESLVVHSREQLADGTGLITATMGIGYKAIRETFTTAVTLDPAARAIVVRHKNGPFRKLENIWSFAPRDEHSCDIHFSIDYEFSSPLLAVIMGAVFDKAFRRFAEAFEERASVVYDRRPLGSPKAMI